MQAVPKARVFWGTKRLTAAWPGQQAKAQAVIRRRIWLDFAGVQQILMAANTGLTSFEPETGRILWHHTPPEVTGRFPRQWRSDRGSRPFSTIPKFSMEPAMAAPGE